MYSKNIFKRGCELSLGESNGSSLQVENKFMRILNYILLIILLVIILAPLLILLNISMKSNEEYMYSGLFALPKNIFNFSNYSNALKLGKFGAAFKNTVVLIVSSTTISVLMGSMVAYALNRFDFKLKKLLFVMFLIPTFIPSITTSIATFTVIKNLGLYNSIFAGMLIYIGTDIMQIYVFLQFMEKIPVSLDESAQIDGASRLRVFFSIIIPQLKPAIATTVILKVLGIYNDFFTPYLYMPKSTLRTVATALNAFSGDRTAQWPLMSAAIIIVAIPTLIIYLFLQKYIMGGITDGAVK
ncbi:MAG: carbohydrate ABC transporter permease [Clostridiaceae bacterium]|nr:carbohydrate ABC transporter permease [Clostridiaceae bacterium]